MYLLRDRPDEATQVPTCSTTLRHTHPHADTSCDIIPELLEGVWRHAPPPPPPPSLHTIFGISELKFMLQRKSADFHLVDTIVN